MSHDDTQREESASTYLEVWGRELGVVLVVVLGWRPVLPRLLLLLLLHGHHRRRPAVLRLVVRGHGGVWSWWHGRVGPSLRRRVVGGVVLRRGGRRGRSRLLLPLQVLLQRHLHAQTRGASALTGRYISARWR